MVSNNIAPYIPMQPTSAERVKELFGVLPLEHAAGTRQPAFFSDGTLLTLDTEDCTYTWDPKGKTWDAM